MTQGYVGGPKTTLKITRQGQLGQSLDKILRQLGQETAEREVARAPSTYQSFKGGWELTTQGRKVETTAKSKQTRQGQLGKSLAKLF